MLLLFQDCCRSVINVCMLLCSRPAVILVAGRPQEAFAAQRVSADGGANRSIGFGAGGSETILLLKQNRSTTAHSPASASRLRGRSAGVNNAQSVLRGCGSWEEESW